MRIVGGAAKGGKLFRPKSAAIRPTSDRVKEALFNILADRTPGARVLDLFAGTGALGIEALSRGAEHCVFVDKSPASLDLVRRNLDLARLSDRARVIKGSAPGVLRALGENIIDLAFLDPPYAMAEGWKALLAHPALLRVLAKDALLVAEHNASREPDFGPFFQIIDTRRYGDTRLSFLSSEISHPKEPS